MKVLVVEPISDEGLERLQAEPRIEVRAEMNPAPERLRELVSDCSGLVVRGATQVDRRLLEQAGKLRIIGRAGTGVDNIDLTAASERGVVVVNTPGGNSISVAELTLGLMLACARRIPRADSALKAGRWEKSALRGHELYGKTLGLVGLGRIGREVARRAAALGMKLLGYDPFVNRQQAQKLEVELVELDELLRRSHVVSLHLPLNERTREMLGREQLQLMKPGAILINAARGGLVDEQALLEALQSGHLQAAACDAFAQEPSPNPQLVGHPSLVATPHIGASTVEAQEQVGYHVAGTVADYLVRGQLRNAVNYISLAPDEARQIQPYLPLAERLGQFAAQAGGGHLQRLSITYRGELASSRYQVLSDRALCGVLRLFLRDVDINPISARSLAKQRQLELEETNTSEPCQFSGQLSLLLECEKERVSVDGALFNPQLPPRLLAVDGLELDLPLVGRLLFFRNDDQPGVVGRLGTLLGQAGINIERLALRADNSGGAPGVARLDRVISEQLRLRVRALPGIRRARMIDLGESIQEGLSWSTFCR